MLHEGRMSATFARGEATQERLLAAAMGRSPALKPPASRRSAVSS
jgi:hypothetical protein